MKEHDKFTQRIACPWCGRGEMLADRKASVTVSVQCPKCHRFYIANLDTAHTECSSAVRKIEYQIAD